MTTLTQPDYQASSIDFLPKPTRRKMRAGLRRLAIVLTIANTTDS